MQEPATDIPVDNIDPNPFQPRKHFPEKEQRELMESIRKNGLIQPIVLRKFEGRYQLLAGERRLRAVKDLGLPLISALCRDLSDEEMQVQSIIENVQREDLSPIDLGKSYQALMEKLSYTQEKVASQLGKDRSTVANTMRLLELPVEIQEDISSKRISSGHGRSLLPLKDSTKIFALRNQILQNKLSVRETEKKVKGLSAPKSPTNPSSVKKTKDPNIISLEEQLSTHLDAKTEIWGETEGSINISFKNVRDFNRIFNLILETEGDYED
ncbi:MAG: ParB/RepB/Spo0J family partition protein [Planctomycetes bacterium]|nr:ParB/RepB/Spo0J family partition protein [Planctomycetota bacterium]